MTAAARHPLHPHAASGRAALVAAVAVSLALGHLIPFGRLLLYPFTLLATWVHEMGHGLAAIVLGGHFTSLKIYADASGVASYRGVTGWRDALVALAGLVAPPVAGAAILVLARSARWARVVLWLLAAALLLSLLFWVRSIVGWLVALPIGLALVAVARLAPEGLTLFVAQFVGLRVALDTLDRMDYLFAAAASGTAGQGTMTSDIASAAILFGGARTLAGVLVAGFSLAVIACGLWIAWRGERMLVQ